MARFPCPTAAAISSRVLLPLSFALLAVAAAAPEREAAAASAVAGAVEGAPTTPLPPSGDVGEGVEAVGGAGAQVVVAPRGSLRGSGAAGQPQDAVSIEGAPRADQSESQPTTAGRAAGLDGSLKGSVAQVPAAASEEKALAEANITSVSSADVSSLVMIKSVACVCEVTGPSNLQCAEMFYSLMQCNNVCTRACSSKGMRMSQFSGTRVVGWFTRLNYRYTAC